jgi:hypothetical protein
VEEADTIIFEHRFKPFGPTWVYLGVQLAGLGCIRRIEPIDFSVVLPIAARTFGRSRQSSRIATRLRMAKVTRSRTVDISSAGRSDPNC